MKYSNIVLLPIEKYATLSASGDAQTYTQLADLLLQSCRPCIAATVGGVWDSSGSNNGI